MEAAAQSGGGLVWFSPLGPLGGYWSCKLPPCPDLPPRLDDQFIASAESRMISISSVISSWRWALQARRRRSAFSSRRCRA